MKQITIIILFIASTISTVAQNDTIKTFTFQGYCELYYSYDFSNPQNHEKPNFIYSHKRHNEINLNLAYASIV